MINYKNLDSDELDMEKSFIVLTKYQRFSDINKLDFNDRFYFFRDTDDKTSFNFIAIPSENAFDAFFEVGKKIYNILHNCKSLNFTISIKNLEEDNTIDAVINEYVDNKQRFDLEKSKKNNVFYKSSTRKNKLSKADEKIIPLVKEWLIVNGNPFAIYFSLGRFEDICIYVYIIQTINVLLFKAEYMMKRKYEKAELEPIIKKLNKLKKYVITDKKIIKENSKLGLVQIERLYGFNPTISKTNYELLNENITTENIIDYLPIIRNILLVSVMRTRKNTFEKDLYSVTYDFPFYNSITKNYNLYPRCNSLVGIALYQLLLNLTAKSYSYKRRICKNPECCNEFEVDFGNVKYCKACRDNNVPERLRVKKCYNKKKKS